MSKLDEKMVEVGYFLSRLGKSGPPRQLNANTWKEAYEKFYPTLGQSRPIKQFQNSLKNLRDHYDGHLTNSRTGWRDNNENPEKLSSLNYEVFLKLQKLDDKQLWDHIRPLAVISYESKLANMQSNLVKTIGLNYFSSEFSGEKMIGARDDNYFQVNHGLVVDSLKDFVSSKFQNDIIFNTQKVDLAIRFNKTITTIFEVKTSTNSQSIYTAVGQLLMHSAGLDLVEKYIVIPKSDFNHGMTLCLTTLNIKIIWYELTEKECFFYFN